MLITTCRHRLPENTFISIRKMVKTIYVSAHEIVHENFKNMLLPVTENK